MTNSQREAIEAARHELVTLNGLIMTDGMAPSETWAIDTHAIVAQLDTAISESSDIDSHPS